MYYLYILKSKTRVWHYIGITDDLKKRFNEHCLGKTKSSKAFRPLELVYKEAFPNKYLARRREIFLKRTYKARQEIFNNINGSIV